LHHTVESEAPEVEFVELSENPQETEEIFELVPVVEGVSEDTNLAGTQGKPGAFIPMILQLLCNHKNWLISCLCISSRS